MTETARPQPQPVIYPDDTPAEFLAAAISSLNQVEACLDRAREAEHSSAYVPDEFWVATARNTYREAAWRCRLAAGYLDQLGWPGCCSWCISDAAQCKLDDCACECHHGTDGQQHD